MGFELAEVARVDQAVEAVNAAPHTVLDGHLLRLQVSSCSIRDEAEFET